MIRVKNDLSLECKQLKNFYSLIIMENLKQKVKSTT